MDRPRTSARAAEEEPSPSAADDPNAAAESARPKLVRLTINVQPVTFAQVRWVMRGVERRGGTLEDMVIPGSSVTRQDVILQGSPGFEAEARRRRAHGLRPRALGHGVRRGFRRGEDDGARGAGGDEQPVDDGT